MTGQIQQETRDRVRVLRMDRPVSNALACEVRAGLLSALQEARGDSSVIGVVIAGAGTGFSSGADLSEYDTGFSEPDVGVLCAEVEDFPKPVVAALHGNVIGTALSLALAAHGRVADAETRLASPEITLGMMPGDGTTQRLPRLIGAELALEIILTGRTVRAAAPRLDPLFDLVVSGDPVPEAVSLVRRFSEKSVWPRSRDCPNGLSDPQQYIHTISTVAKRLNEGESAARDILSAVEAAQLLPFDQGLAFERVLFEGRLQSPGARAQRHVHSAERRAAIMPELAEGPVRALQRISFSGPALADVTVAFLDAGKEVQSDDAGLLARVSRIYDAAVVKGDLDEAAVETRLARLGQGLSSGWADLVLAADETADPRSLAVEGGVIARLDVGMGLDQVQLGLRFYRPAHVLHLAEIAVSADAAPGDVASLARMCAEMGRVAVRTASVAAGIGAGHRMAGALYLASFVFLRLGYSPVELDLAGRQLGLREGPFTMMDREGLAIVASRLQAMSKDGGDELIAALNVLAERLSKGATGRAVGRGFYDYPPEGARISSGFSQPGSPSPGLAQGVGLPEALHAALVNEAARLVADGAVQRPGDLDVIMVRGYGFDRSRGGPLFQADQRGVLAVLKDMKALAEVSERLWRPDPMIVEIVKNGGGFFS